MFKLFACARHIRNLAYDVQLNVQSAVCIHPETVILSDAYFLPRDACEYMDNTNQHIIPIICPANPVNIPLPDFVYRLYASQDSLTSCALLGQCRSYCASCFSLSMILFALTAVLIIGMS